jgi:hypothetical protein
MVRLKGNFNLAVPLQNKCIVLVLISLFVGESRSENTFDLFIFFVCSSFHTVVCKVKFSFVVVIHNNSTGSS